MDSQNKNVKVRKPNHNSDFIIKYCRLKHIPLKKKGLQENGQLGTTSQSWDLGFQNHSVPLFSKKRKAMRKALNCEPLGRSCYSVQLVTSASCDLPAASEQSALDSPRWPVQDRVRQRNRPGWACLSPQPCASLASTSVLHCWPTAKVRSGGQAPGPTRSGWPELGGELP